jgi:methylmalonyl-CoA/ethylmalonyl-CoA epimerase
MMANDSIPHDVSPITGQGMTLHHVGIVVADQGVEVAAFHAPPGYVELISPLDPDGAIARFHAKRGDGMHHAAYRVDDLAAELDRLAAAGVRLIDCTPRIGLHGWRVAFIHPEACAGVLTELVEV